MIEWAAFTIVMQRVLTVGQTWKAWRARRNLSDAEIACADAEAVSLAKWWTKNSEQVSDGTSETGVE